jgi:hypothetical protein
MVSVRFLAQAGIFSFNPHSDQLWAHPASYPMDTSDSSLGIKWPEYEADHFLPPNDEIKMH